MNIKFLNTLVYLIRKLGRKATFTRIMYLLFYLDNEHLKKYGKVYTNSEYKYSDYGPVNKDLNRFRGAYVPDEYKAYIKIQILECGKFKTHIFNYIGEEKRGVSKEAKELLSNGIFMYKSVDSKLMNRVFGKMKLGD